jgi:hypothetical protein
MLRAALFGIIRQEQHVIENQLGEEEKQPAPDIRRLVALRREVQNLRRELEHFPDA